MAISVFDLFKVGIGPSSSHTGGPMAAAHRFARGLRRDGLLEKTASVRAVLYGSLGLTGKGHGSDKAVILGLEGGKPELVDVDTVDDRLARCRDTGLSISALMLENERAFGRTDDEIRGGLAVNVVEC